ncbi:MAG: zinc ABC transporter substrate-binding protein, partial [Acidobacteriota bacterium]
MKKVFLALVIVAVMGMALLVGRNFFVLPKVPSGRFQITASFYPLYFFATEIAGDRADVYNLTPGGAEPHDFELKAGDRAKVEDSRLLIINGGKFEPWGDQIVASLHGSRTRALIVGDGNIDPHIWLSPRLAKAEATKILGALSEVDPSNAGYYSERFNLLSHRFDDLDVEYRAGLTNCEKKDIITAHSAFGRLALEYGFSQIGISGISPDEEPSPQKLGEITDLARQKQIKYIFFESLVSPKLAETIAGEVGAETLVLNPLEGISDEEAARGEDYFSVMRKN